MIGREKLTEAVNLSIGLQRGYYLGTVERDKRAALEALTGAMSPDERWEFDERVR